MVICNQSRGMFFLIIFKSGPSFPLKIDNHSIQVYPFSALVQRLICSKTDGKASSQSNMVTEKHTQPNEANLCGINFLQKRKLLNFHPVFKKYLLILAVWDLSYGTWELSPLCMDFLVVARGFSCSAACGTLVPRPGIKPESLTLVGRFLATGPPGKSFQGVFFKGLFVYFTDGCSRFSVAAPSLSLVRASGGYSLVAALLPPVASLVAARGL